ncbi:Uncharacterised protein g1034 [Pycnogonum litorale]
MCEPISFRQNAIRIRRSSVRKCLFGHADKEETKKLLQDDLQKQRLLFKQRWAYDVVKDKPVLDGELQWKPITLSVDDECSNSDSSGVQSTSVVDTANNDKVIQGQHVASSSTSRENEVSNTSSTKQSKITDFMPKRKLCYSGDVTTSKKSKRQC